MPCTSSKRQLSFAALTRFIVVRLYLPISGRVPELTTLVASQSVFAKLCWKTKNNKLWYDQRNFLSAHVSRRKPQLVSMQDAGVVGVERTFHDYANARFAILNPQLHFPTLHATTEKTMMIV